MLTFLMWRILNFNIILSLVSNISEVDREVGKLTRHPLSKSKSLSSSLFSPRSDFCFIGNVVKRNIAWMRTNWLTSPHPSKQLKAGDLCIVRPCDGAISVGGRIQLDTDSGREDDLHRPVAVVANYFKSTNFQSMISSPRSRTKQF